MMAHSLEAGNLQVRNDIVAQGQLQVAGGVNVGADGLFSAGNVGISGTLRVNTLASGGSIDVCVNGNVLSDCSSSRRYKQNINGLTLGLETVAQLEPVTFEWQSTDQLDLGFIAEEVAEINPLLVTTKNGDLEGVKYKQLSAVLVNTFKQQQAQLKAQQAQLEILITLVCVDHPQAEFCKE